MVVRLLFVGQFRSIEGNNRLGNVVQGSERFAGLQTAGYRTHRLLAHAIRENIGTALDKNTRPQSVLPIVVMGNATQRSLNTPYHHRNVGIKLFEYAGIDDGRIVGTHASTTVGRIGIVGT